MKVFVDSGFTHPMLLRLKPYMAQMGVELVNYPYSNCEVHYSHVNYTIDTPIPRPKVLRLDGCYYDGVQDNTPLKKSYEMSDHIIFQSEFSRHLCMDRLQPRKEIPYTIIYNAGDYWRNPEPHEGFHIVCCANWRRWKRLKEIIKIYRKFPFPSMLHVIGYVENRYPDLYYDDSDIKYHGNLFHTDMEKLYRTMDVGIHIAKRDACPNSIVEFISAGLPVIASNKGGGATELVTMTPGCRIAEGDHDPHVTDIVKQYSEEWNDLPKEFEESLINNLVSIYKHRPKTYLSTQLLPEYVAEQYVKVFKKAK